ncbi:MAG: hypothetical protein AAGD25_11335 [Cyanobacteria bacterium P01_F01_bin.150]
MRLSNSALLGLDFHNGLAVPLRSDVEFAGRPAIQNIVRLSLEIDGTGEAIALCRPTLLILSAPRAIAAPIGQRLLSVRWHLHRGDWRDCKFHAKRRQLWQ